MSQKDKYVYSIEEAENIIKNSLKDIPMGVSKKTAVTKYIRKGYNIRILENNPEIAGETMRIINDAFEINPNNIPFMEEYINNGVKGHSLIVIANALNDNIDNEIVREQMQPKKLLYVFKLISLGFDPEDFDYSNKSDYRLQQICNILEEYKDNTEDIEYIKKLYNLKYQGYEIEEILECKNNIEISTFLEKKIFTCGSLYKYVFMKKTPEWNDKKSIQTVLNSINQVYSKYVLKYYINKAANIYDVEPSQLYSKKEDSRFGEKYNIYYSAGITNVEDKLLATLDIYEQSAKTVLTDATYKINITDMNKEDFIMECKWNGYDLNVIFDFKQSLRDIDMFTELLKYNEEERNAILEKIKEIKELYDNADIFVKTVIKKYVNS